MAGGDTENWEQIEQLFTAALEQPAKARSAFLDDACGTDTPIRDEVDRLLAADTSAPGLLDQPWSDDDPVLAPSGLAQGQSVGAWRIVSELGRGGMGIVYLAERADGAYEQQVALKVIGGGILAATMESRFIRERRILGRLQHPNIARLLDAGSTDEGLPFLVMELVQGTPITQWCRESGRSINERLRLALQICDALRHAHQNLVVHRDLKPGNIFVDRNGNARLLDFGVARILSGDEDVEQPRTRQGMLPITPEYAAPEQLSDVDVTTSADIYSLGAVLYELLSNRRPREGISGSPLEIHKLLQQAVPAPSTSANIPSQWRRQVQGDLDAIVLKAMAPEPGRRYASATELADDIHRYLRREPVRARPDSYGYRLGKFVHRHRVGVAAMLAVATAIGAGMVTTAWQAREAAEQAAKAESVKNFALSLFEGVDPARALGEELTARQLVDDGAERMRSELVDQPVVRAEVLTLLADMYDKMDDDGRALELVDEAIGLLDEPDYEALAAALLVKGRVLVGRSEDDDAVTALERALSIHTELREDLSVAEALDLVATVRTRQNDLAEATELTERALEIRLPLLGEDHTEVVASYNNLGFLARKRGDYPAARRHYEKALEIRRQVLPGDHPHVAISLNNLGALENVEGNYVRASDLFAESLDINRRVNGELHHDTIAALNNFGFVQMRLGHFEAARQALSAVYDYWVGQDKADHPNALVTRVNLAAVRRAAGDAAGALPEFEELELSLANTLGAEHPFVAVTLHHQARCLLDVGELDAAERLISRALAMREKAFGPNHPGGADLMVDQARVALLEGDFEAAGQLANRALDLQRSTLPSGHPSISMSELVRGRIALATGEVRRALELQQAALDDLIRRYPDTYPDLADAHFELGKTLLANGQSAEAREHLRKARDARLARYSDSSWQVAEVELSMADAIKQQGNLTEAAALRTSAVRRIDAQLAGQHPLRQQVRAEQAP